MLNPLTPQEFQIPPANFGDGWLTKAGQDMCKIAIAFGGFEPSEIVMAIHEIHRGDGLANITTVTNALQNLYDDHRDAEPA